MTKRLFAFLMLVCLLTLSAVVVSAQEEGEDLDGELEIFS